MYVQNFYIEGNEFVITNKKGTYLVLEEYAGYKAVFAGSYKSCIKYIDDRFVEYYSEI